MARKRKKIKVFVEPLGRQKAYGLALQNHDIVFVDDRTKPKFFCQLICHEIGHIFFENESEHRINEFGKALAQALFDNGFRRVYDENKLMKPRKLKAKKRRASLFYD